MGRGSCRCEGDGVGGEAEACEQDACERGVGNDSDDAAAPAAGALEHVVCEHALQEVSPRQAARAWREGTSQPFDAKADLGAGVTVPGGPLADWTKIA